MTTKRMLIDASHPEETRVAIVSGNHLEDFDVEVESRRQLRGNIYLAKVTRVEPSLQAAFVDYGGNRHGFLAFSEIHPDYYQIPVADREALLEEQQAAGTEAEALEDGDHAEQDAESPKVETLGGDDTEEVAARRPVALRRKYKIQEVIKRRQILLIQVVKEERGTKGAALTTYLSLAGRYCVLMPNTARGGGISRKIGLGADRKHLKSILNDLAIPKGMAVIVRTAGQKRSKPEIKRDYEYLMRVWNSVRETTLESMAPCLVHEEGNLVKRSIRDLYDKDIDEIIIDGDAGYRAAKDFMKQLIPSHTKRVQPFKEVDKQLFQHYGVESQMDGMHSPEVQLKSGGYIVINPTEALVSIDVNSGRATRGRNIEETALKTNLEASDEIARQLKLRDLAGLIVIDFIDMEIHRNQSKVERRLKDVMRSDRARIQIGRISPFGLMELSRQRLRPSLIETSSEPCPYCEGTGIRRSKDSAALHLLRALEEEGMQHRSKEITVYIPSLVAVYILNHKRAALAETEKNYQLSITIEIDDSLIPPDYRLERVKGEQRKRGADAGAAEGEGAGEEGGKRRRRRRSRRRHSEDAAGTAPEPTEAAETSTDDQNVQETTPDNEGAPGPARGKRRRRGRRGGRRRGRRPAEQTPVAKPGEAPLAGHEAPIQGGENVVSFSEPEAPVKPAADVKVEGAELPDEGKASKAKKKPARGQKAKSASTDGGKPEKKTPRKSTRRPRAVRAQKPETEPNEGGKDETVQGASEKPAGKKPAPRPRRSAKTKDAPSDDKAPSTTEPIDAGKPVEIPISPGPAEQAIAASASKESKTNVTNVGAESKTDKDENKSQGRKGWWSQPS